MLFLQLSVTTFLSFIFLRNIDKSANVNVFDKVVNGNQSMEYNNLVLINATSLNLSA